MANRGNNKNTLIAIACGAVCLVGAVVLLVALGAFPGGSPTGEAATVESLASKVDHRTAKPVLGQVSATTATLAEELPDIDSSYPVKVTGSADVVVELMASGEKAGDGTDGWMCQAAEAFNKSGATLPDGRTVAVSVRSVPSGTGADYVSSGKHLPDIWSPSSELVGDLASTNGATLVEVAPESCGNQAGVLVKKGSGHSDIGSIVEAVEAGELSLGYTNPSTSAAGLNLLVTVLKSADGDVGSDAAAEAFAAFDAGVPYVALTTQQMRDSAMAGTLEAIVSERQTYDNDAALQASYDFVPFGAAHSSPLYLCAEGNEEAVRMVCDYLTSDAGQAYAESCGFQKLGTVTGDEVTAGDAKRALAAYKAQKNAGHDTVCVFVCDTSGSMEGESMAQLKESLSNSMRYIGDSAHVGLVSYGSDVTVEVPIAQWSLDQMRYLQGAIDSMAAHGNTHSYEALCVALQMVSEYQQSHEGARGVVFLLSDGQANGSYTLPYVRDAVASTGVTVHTIAYGDQADTDQLAELASVNEGAAISATSDDVVYRMKTLFDAEL